MQKLGYALLILVLGGVIGWLIKPVDYITNTKFIEKTDSVEVITPVLQEPIKIVKWLPTKTDTVFIANIDSSYIADLLTDYYCNRQKLINSGVEEIQSYEKVTAKGDTLNIEYDAIADYIMKAEIKFAAREVVTKNYKTTLIPPSKEDEWYVKPAIAISSLAVGYVIRGN